MTPDLKGLHYLTAANQPQLDHLDKSPGIGNGGPMFMYSPWEFTCCQHNVSHGWPYYAEELWLATGDRGLCALLYAASEATAKVGDGIAATLVETTDYPFRLFHAAWSDHHQRRVPSPQRNSDAGHTLGRVAGEPAIVVQINGDDSARRRARTSGTVSVAVRGSRHRFCTTMKARPRARNP